MTKKALVVGLGDAYGSLLNGEFEQLPKIADGNMPRLITRLKSKGWEVISRTEMDVTKPQITDFLKGFKYNCKKGDKYLFYFSGHGSHYWGINSKEPSYSENKKEEFMVTYHPSLKDENVSLNAKIIEEYFITDNLFRELIEPILKAEATFISVLDCCNAGGLIDGLAESYNVPENYKNHILFAATGENREAWINPNGDSWFTEALLEASNKGGDNWMLAANTRKSLKKKTNKQVPKIVIPQHLRSNPSFV